MTGIKRSYLEQRYKEHPKTLPKDDFWGQVSRTVNGARVDQEQIDFSVNAILAGLSLRSEDYLLDIGCGNGALSHYLFGKCGGFHGIDYSPYLIEVAKSNFQRPGYTFQEAEVGEYLRTESDPGKFTKAVCYGTFAYFPAPLAETILKALSAKFENIETIFIGNLPDREKADLFFTKFAPEPGLLDNHDSAIGIWRTKTDVVHLGEKTGWTVEFRQMPEKFYAAHYRYDAILRWIK